MPNNFPVTVQFDFTPNARPWQYRLFDFPGNYSDAVPDFAGLTPGFVGLYQVNVKLPDKFPPISACNGIQIASNLLINIRINSWDGAPICVEPTP
jgi:hypothetical protein